MNINHESVAEKSAYSNQFPESTLALNDTVANLQMLILKLAQNQNTIDTEYEKVSMGGLCAANSQLASDLLDQLDALSGLCWAQINASCSSQTTLELSQWQQISKSQPEWLRDIFVSAILLTGMPDDESLERLPENGRILVIRDVSTRQESGLLTNVAALMPKGLTSDDIRIWWPWVMGSGSTPVILKTSENPNVLFEFANDSLQAEQAAELSAV